MPQPPDWKRVLETGVQFTEMRRSQAYRIASDLVAQGQLARDQLGAAVDEIVEMSRRRSEELRTIIRDEVQRQLGVLGLATKRDLDLLERKLRGAKTAPKSAPKGGPAKRKPAAKKPAAVPAKRKAAAKKSPATKTAAKKTSATKAAAKKTARKATAKKTAARSATRRTGTTKAVRKPAAQRAR